MNAQDLPVAQLLDGAKQFIVPIFQRDYSWGTKHCLQLWNDIVRVGNDPSAKGHFLGSVVYVAAEDNTAGITRWLLIDGQQRMTTLTLVLIALRDHLASASHQAGEAVPSSEEIDDYFLRNRHGKGDRRHKLLLRRADNDTLAALLDGKPLSAQPSVRIHENYLFIKDLISQADPAQVFSGIKKLIVVDVCLTRGQDDPQMIFESLNSTGEDLTQADLIRNFVLMRLDEATQTRLYEDYWQPIEQAFGNRYRSDFDTFVRDYLGLRLQATKPLVSDQIYHQFRAYFLKNDCAADIDAVLSDIRRFGNYYTSFSLGQEPQPRLKECFVRLRGLVEVASPVVMSLYDCYDLVGTLSLDGFVEAIELLESYVFRRSVCEMQTRNLGQIFSSLAAHIDPTQPLLSLKVALYRQGKKRRFPTDAEFREALETRDVYDMRNCFYLLDRLENDSNERIDTSTFTIEHVMPQNSALRAEWAQMLGEDWTHVQETWLHRLGNLTLTGYNSTYSDRPFAEKKSVKGGFDDSPLRLNRFIREQSVWTAIQMTERGKKLAEKALHVWPTLIVDGMAVRKQELEERIALAAKYSVDDIGMDGTSRELLNLLRPQIQALGDDVVELPNDRSVIYSVLDFFVEIIPRKQRLTLLLSLELSECDDPSGDARDANEFAFIVGAKETGGVLYPLEDPDGISAAMHVVRQAYERVTE